MTISIGTTIVFIIKGACHEPVYPGKPLVGQGELPYPAGSFVHSKLFDYKLLSLFCLYFDNRTVLEVQPHTLYIISTSKGWLVSIVRPLCPPPVRREKNLKTRDVVTWYPDPLAFLSWCNLQVNIFGFNVIIFHLHAVHPFLNDHGIFVNGFPGLNRIGFIQITRPDNLICVPS